MRFNPYGSKTIDNPDNRRIPMARMDPRQRGLVNAAWTVGYLAHLARGGIHCVNLHAPTGEFGLLNYPEAWSRPGFDNTEKQIFPAYHVVKGLADACGKQQIFTYSNNSREVECFSYRDNGRLTVWVANLTSDTRHVELRGINASTVDLATLSVDTFDQCTDHYNGFEQTSRESTLPHIELGPYSVVRASTQTQEPSQSP